MSGREEETLTELRRGEKMSALLGSLLAIHKGDAAELARLLLFLLASELAGKAERATLVAALVETCEEHALPGYLRAAWELERRGGEAVALFYDLVVARSHARVR